MKKMAIAFMSIFCLSNFIGAMQAPATFVAPTEYVVQSGDFQEPIGADVIAISPVLSSMMAHGLRETQTGIIPIAPEYALDRTGLRNLSFLMRAVSAGQLAHKTVEEIQELINKSVLVVPNIHDYIFDLLGIAALWQLPYIPTALMRYVINHVDLNDAKQLENLMRLSQEEKIDLLMCYEPQVLTVLPALSLLATVENGKEKDVVAAKLVDFIVRNIVALMNYYPDLVNLLVSPQFAFMQERLKHQLIRSGVIREIEIKEQKKLRGHTGTVFSVAKLDTDHIVSGAGDTTIRIWDLKTGISKESRGGQHTDMVSSVAVMDQNHIVSGSYDETVRLWNLQKETSSEGNGHTGYVYSVAKFDQDHIVSGSADKTIRLWDLKAGVSKKLQGDQHTRPVNSVEKFDQDHIVSGSDDKTVRLWDLKAGTSRILEGDQHTAAVRTVAKYDQDHIVSGSDDKTIRLWDLKAGTSRILEGNQHTGPVLSVAKFDQDDHIVSGSRDITVRIWDLKMGTNRILRGEQHTASIGSVAVLDKEHVVSGSFDAAIRIWWVPDLLSLQELLLKIQMAQSVFVLSSE